MDDRDKKNALSKGSLLKSPQHVYRIEEVLGAGGFGITYKVSAEVEVGNIKVFTYFAVKEHFLKDACERAANGSVCYSNPSKEKVEESRRDFMAEAKRLNRLSGKHRNIVCVNEVFEANNTVYYVMQYLENESVRKLVRSKGQMSEMEALAVILPIARAVAFLHDNRITHLDIKPDNIMLNLARKGEELIPVLIDFGLAKHYDKSGKPTSDIRVQGCSDGYAPQEQYAGISVFSPEADVYALGATLYYLLVGKDPVIATEQSASNIVRCLPEGLSERTRQAILKAMSKDKNDRTPTATEFVRSLEKTYVLPVGYLLRSPNACYQILQVENEKANYIQYRARLYNSLSEGQTPNRKQGTVELVSYVIKEEYDRQTDSRTENGGVQKPVTDSGGKASDFITQAWKDTGLQRECDVSFRNGDVQCELFVANGTHYSVVKNSPHPSFPVFKVLLCVALLVGVVFIFKRPSPSPPPPPPPPPPPDVVVVGGDTLPVNASLPVVPDTVKPNSVRPDAVQPAPVKPPVQSAPSFQPTQAQRFKSAMEMPESQRLDALLALAKEGYVKAYCPLAELYIKRSEDAKADKWLQKAAKNKKYQAEALKWIGVLETRGFYE